MERCPPEVLHEVFRLACTDDGYTGRSLSLVSTRIRDISAAHKHFSVHVVGTARLAKFATTVSKFEAQVRYLMLDCSKADITRPTGDTQDSDSNHDNSVRSITAILCALQRTLKGLYLALGPVGHLPLETSRLTFPLLEAFYVFGNLHHASFSWNQRHFPRLTQLNLSCNPMTSDGHGHMLSQADIPSLTHFACCCHDDSSLLVVVFMAVTSSLRRFSIDNNKELEGPTAKKLSQLDILRVQVPGVILHELRSIVCPLSGRCAQRGPIIIGAGHDEMRKDSGVPTGEWDYIVQGGNGFLADE